MPEDQPDPAALALLDATRDLADRVWRTLIPSADRAVLAEEIAALAARLDPIERVAPVRTEVASTLPGRGNPLLPPLVRTPGNGRSIGTITYTTAHAGAGPAVHGGNIALLFDDVLGGVANTAAMSRTAYLTVNYRNLTRVGAALTVEGWVERVDGRKILVRGRLLDGEQVCADAEGLFIAVQSYG
jgi:acyl-coenzyme A thioesterase PaaI-like protein